MPPILSAQSIISASILLLHGKIYTDNQSAILFLKRNLASALWTLGQHTSYFQKASMYLVTLQLTILHAIRFFLACHV